MHSTETVIVKIAKPSKNKAEWLESMAGAFSQGVQIALDAAQAKHTSSRTKIHQASYKAIRDKTNLPADYARMAVNAGVSLARSYYGLRQSKHQPKTSFPKVNGSQGIGLGINAYSIKQAGHRYVLRCSTGNRGKYIWLPLCVPQRFQDKIPFVKGDAKIFKRANNWFVMLPVKPPQAETPAVRDGEPTFIGVDLGVVRIATVSTPDGVIYFHGKEARHKREHFADLRRRYQRHNRLDKVKALKGKERRWMTDLNHLISRRMVEIATHYENPVIVLERLDGIRYRMRGSKRFNRMMASWAFRQLITFVGYKAAQLGIPVMFVDPRGTSKRCHKCGSMSRANRPSQALFRCVACNHQDNADANASYNIAVSGARLWAQGLPDIARPSGQTDPVGGWPDEVKVRLPLVV